MRKCQWCGAEYPDSVEKCVLDHQPLADGKPETSPSAGPLVAITSVQTATMISCSTSSGPSKRLTERQLRLFEVILVCAIAFGGTVLYSVGIYFGLRPRAPGGGTLRWLNSGLQEIACLALVWYILSRRSVSFKDLGLCWRWKDLGHSLIVWTLGMLAFSIVYGLIYLTGFVSGTGAEANFRVANLLFGARVSSLAIGFQFLNPFFEELIVRAYLMTEVRQLTNNMPAAVLVSTVLQTSYHLYQGAPLAISEGAIFLAFSLCYAKTNRVTPIVLAHLYLDLWPTLRMWFTQG